MQFWRNLFAEKEKRKKEDEERVEILRNKIGKTSPTAPNTPKLGPIQIKDTKARSQSDRDKSIMTFESPNVSRHNSGSKISKKDSHGAMDEIESNTFAMRVRKGFSILIGKKDVVAFHQSINITNDFLEIPNFVPTRIFTHQEAAIYIPSQLRGYLSRKRMKIYCDSELFATERKRLETIEEIFESERLHIKRLNKILNLFYKPMKEKKLVAQDKIEMIFGNMEQIRDANERLMSDLQDEERRNPTCPRIGLVFKNNIESLRVYSRYIVNYDISLAELEKQEKKNKPLVSFLEKVTDSSDLDGLNFRSLLICPVQRIPKYQLLFRDLYDRTPPEHVDYADIEYSLKSVVMIVNDANEGKRYDESQSLLQELQEYIIKNGNTLKYRKVLLTRKIVYHGTLEVGKEMTDTEHANTIPVIYTDFYRVFLLTDILFMVPVTQSSTNVDRDKFCGKIEFIHLLFSQFVGKKTKKFRLQAFTRNDLYIYEFTAPSQKVAETWIRHIQTQIGEVCSMVDTLQIDKMPILRNASKIKYSQIEKDFALTEIDFLAQKKRWFQFERERREQIWSMLQLKEDLDGTMDERNSTAKSLDDIEDHLIELRKNYSDTDKELKELDRALFLALNSETDIFSELFTDTPTGIEVNDLPDVTMHKKRDPNVRIDLLSFLRKSGDRKSSDRKSSDRKSGGRWSGDKKKSFPPPERDNDASKKSGSLSDDVLRKQGIYLDEFNPTSPPTTYERKKVTKSMESNNETDSNSSATSPVFEVKRLSDHESIAPLIVGDSRRSDRIGSLIENFRKKQGSGLYSGLVSEVSTPPPHSGTLSPRGTSPDPHEELKKEIFNSLPSDLTKLNEILSLIKK